MCNRVYIGLYRDYIGNILGLYWDNGKENGNYYNGLYRVTHERSPTLLSKGWGVGLRASYT